MKKIQPKVKLELSNITKKNLPKLNNKKTSSVQNKLERTPVRDYYDFSTEDRGYFTRKDEKGNVLEEIRIMFPR